MNERGFPAISHCPDHAASLAEIQPGAKHEFRNDAHFYFLRRFLPPGTLFSRESLHAACLNLHLAFGKQSADEVYSILAGLLIKVINGYDPCYTDKVKLVVEAINRLGGSGRT